MDARALEGRDLYSIRPILSFSGKVQKEVRHWRAAKLVIFDAAKKHFAIVYSGQPFGEYFDLLGVKLDTKLCMHVEITKVAIEGSDRINVLLKVRKHYNVSA